MGFYAVVSHVLYSAQPNDARPISGSRLNNDVGASMGKRQRILAACIALWFVAGATHGQKAEDCWPMWRGPHANGVAPKGNPPLTWSESANIVWKVPLPGQGSSSPIVWGDKLLFLAAEEVGRVPPTGSEERPVYRFDIVCLDRTTGKTLWRRTACEEQPHQGHHPNHGYASYSPVTDGTHVWASFGSRDLHCYDLDGNPVWSVDLGKMTTRLNFGEGSSPTLAGEKVIVLSDHEGDSCIRAFDKATGELVWKRERDEGTSWSTPLAIEVNGHVQVITSATNFVRSYDAKTSESLWQCAGQTPSVVPTPVAGFGLVFCTSGYRGNTLQAIRLDHTGDLTGTDAVAWEVHEATPYVPSPLLYEDTLYVCSGNRAIVSCYDARMGTSHYVAQRLEGMKEIYASPVGAAGRVYFAGRDGKTAVLERGREFRLLAINELDDAFDATPAIVGDAIFLKGKRHLYCISENAETGAR